jgi:hypothetical protein
MELYKILFWILPISVLLHLIEEFIFPGGFMVWDRDYRPAISKNKHPRFLIIVNALLFAICFNPILSGLTNGGIEWWLSIVSILFVNAYFHIKGVIVLKRYSPGVITSIFIYTPLATYGYWYFLSEKKVNWITAILCFTIGIAYHLFSSYNPLRKLRYIKKQ